MVRWWAVVVLVGVAGCFSDVPTGGGSGSTGSTSCTPGEVLCACRGDATCDMGLACVPEGCIPDACNPGEAMCTCLQPGDVCAQGSTCIEGLCRDEPITTDGMTSMPSQTDTTSEPPPTSTIGPGTTTDETVGTTMIADTGAQESGVVECSEEPLCTDCALCAAQNGCEDQYDACANDKAGCFAALTCINACLHKGPSRWGDCIDSCGCGENSRELQLLMDCTEDVCESSCMADLPCSSIG